MARTADRRPDETASIPRAMDAIFGRWPAWPWSTLALVASGGLLGAAAAGGARAAFPAHAATLGTAACAGYGAVAAAFLSLVPRAVRLLMLRPRLAGRTVTIDGSWWPLTLLAAALRSTPMLRRTPEEFNAAVNSAVGEARTILAARLWPAWATAFVAPVLGLMTAWQNGAEVQLRLEDGATPARVFPALIAEVSPPMLATIGASLALMLAVVVVDQCTKGLLIRWRGTVEPADADRPAVREKLAIEPVAAEAAATIAREPPTTALHAPLPKRLRDPEELDRKWRESARRE